MNEFRAELERDGRAGIVAREDAAAYPRPRLDHGDAQSRLGQVARRGEAGGACPEYREINAFPVGRHALFLNVRGS